MQIRGLDFNVEIKGDGETFVWGHGLSTSIESEEKLDWFDWASFPESVRLVRYDARGHGKSELSRKPEDYHWRNLGADMLALADALGADQFIAGGASMGCATTICAAIQAPQRMKGLVLVIPPTAWETRAAQASMYNRFAVIAALLGGKAMGKMIAGRFDKILPPWMVEKELEQLSGIKDGVAARKRTALYYIFKGAALTDLPPREEFEKIAHIPCQILAWEDDSTHPVSSAQEIHRLLPGSELFIAQGYEEFKTIPGHLREFVQGLG